MDPATIGWETGPPGHGVAGKEGVRELHAGVEPNEEGPGRGPRFEKEVDVNGLQSNQHLTSKLKPIPKQIIQSTTRKCSPRNTASNKTRPRN